jgi:hypothetical protein
MMILKKKVKIMLKDGLPPFKILDFPCEASLKRIVVHNKKEFIKVFKNVERYRDEGMYNSNYAFDMIDGDKPDYNSARIDKAQSDIDLDDHGYDPERCYQSMLKAHNWCEKYGLQHSVHLTGSGYQVFFGIDPFFVKDDDKSLYISTLLKIISKMTGAIFCHSCYKDPVSRISRTVGSRYSKKKKRRHLPKETETGEIAKNKKKWLDFIERNDLQTRYCASLNHELIHSGYEKIFEASKERTFTKIIMGSKRILLFKLDVKKYKKPSSFFFENKISINVDPSKISNIMELMERFGIWKKEVPYCIENLMNKPSILKDKPYKKRHIGYFERMLLISWMTKMGLSYNEILIVFKKILLRKTYYHVTVEEKDHIRKVLNAMKNGKDYDVNCTIMKDLGYCSSYCERYSIYQNT